jgi:hypothetical protein
MPPVLKLAALTPTETQFPVNSRAQSCRRYDEAKHKLYLFTYVI